MCRSTDARPIAFLGRVPRRLGVAGRILAWPRLWLRTSKPDQGGDKGEGNLRQRDEEKGDKHIEIDRDMKSPMDAHVVRRAVLVVDVEFVRRLVFKY